MKKHYQAPNLVKRGVLAKVTAQTTSAPVMTPTTPTPTAG